MTVQQEIRGVHEYTASPNAPDFYSQTALQEPLKPYGYKVKLFDEVDSTQDEALLLPNERWIVVADFQHKGRGRRGKSWQSEKYKSILFSINEPWDGDPKISPLLSHMFALSLCIGLQKATGNSDIAIRPPSDLTVKGNNGEKLGGILIENRHRRKIFGAGINTFPQEFGDTDYGAITLTDVCEGPLRRQDLLVAIIIAWDHALKDLRRINETATYDSYNSLWHENAALTGRTVQIEQDDVVVRTGIVMKSHLGKPIMLQTQEGEVFLYERYDGGTKIRVTDYI